MSVDAGLHLRWPGGGLVESAFDIDDPAGYWTSTRTARLIPPPAEAADAVTESLALRAAELPFHHTARFTGHRVTPEELDAFSDRLVAELTRPGEQTDVTLWINDRLTRHEAAVQPVTDLRLLA
ncbi:hypothetical protein ABZW30_37100 [Kitasatospora sp. NPDC004669]|uniref:hypothetical protein n=1 Tax=Kitasatospora sp. NPDC004669 TaxID=3154555 RepID=UPI0033AE8FEC